MNSAEPPRVLLVLPQMPQDPAAGAARSLSAICEFLVCSGFQVHALGTTACETSDTTLPDERLVLLEIDFKSTDTQPRELRFTRRGVDYRLLHVGASDPTSWQDEHGIAFDRIFDEELAQFRPHIVFTYGGLESDIQRRRRARSRGARVVFGLRNLNYLNAPHCFQDLDAALTPSQFLSDAYRNAFDLRSFALPTPLIPEDVIAPEHDPIFVTFVNPSLEKGIVVMARLAEELSCVRPDLPILVVESRGKSGHLAFIAEQSGFDLRRHENIMFSPAVPAPRDIYGPTRVIVAPSLEDAAPRVIAEAMMNGIPPLVSNRGGLPEMAEGAGFVFELPDEVSVERRETVGPEVVRPWVETIIRLFDDEEFYSSECARARNAAKRFSPEVLAPQYAKYFFDVIARR